MALVAFVLAAAGGSAPSSAGPDERRLTVVIQGGAGSVVSAPAGITCSQTCSAAFSAATTVSLTPAPDDGFEFSGWDNDCTGTGPCAVSMAEERSVVALFRRVGTVTLDVLVVGRGSVAVSPPGIGLSGSAVGTCGPVETDGQPCTLAYPRGTTVTLTPAGELDSPFQAWGDDACVGAATCTLQTGDDYQNVTATFAGPLLTVRLSGDGFVESDEVTPLIECGSPPQEPPPPPPPPPGFAVQRGLPPSPRTPTAAASPQEVLQTGGCSAAYPPGAVVRLTARAEPGSAIRWTFGCDAIDTPAHDATTLSVSTCLVTVANRPLAVGVAFASSAAPSDVYIRLKVTKAGGGAGTVGGGRIDCGGRCSASLPFGTRVTLRADPAADSRFDRWRGACGTDTVCAVQVGAVTGVQALFAPRPGDPQPQPPTVTHTVTTTVTRTETTPGARRVLAVSLESVGVTGRRSGRRIVVRAHVNQPAYADIRVLLGSRRTAGRRTLQTGVGRVFLRVPARWPRGRARVEVVVRGVEFGSSPTFVRRVLLPR